MLPQLVIKEIFLTDKDFDNIVSQVANIWIDAQRTTFLPLMEKINNESFQRLTQSEDFLSFDRLQRLIRCRLKNHFRLIVAYDSAAQNTVLGYAQFISFSHSVDLELFLDAYVYGETEELLHAHAARIEQALSSSKLYVEELMIHSSVQRGGIGTSLLNYIFTWGRNNGYESCTLSCLEQNEKAYKFYEKLGFEKQEDFINKDKIRAVVFKKNLKS